MKKNVALPTVKNEYLQWNIMVSFVLILFFLLPFQELSAQPCPTITTSANVAICSGSAQSIVLSTDMPDALFSWTVEQKGVVGAADGTGSAILGTLTATDAKIGSVVYTITPLAKGCSGNSKIMNLIVLPTPIAIATPLSSTITSGNATSIALSSDAVGTAFTWTVIQSAVAGAIAGSGSAIRQTLTTVAETGIATYRITPDLNSCKGESINARVTVKKKP